MRRIDLESGERLTPEMLARSGGVDAEVLSVASRIVDDVRARGDAALHDYTLQFDGADVSEARVGSEEIAAALEAVPREVRDALEAAAGAIEDFHRRELPQSWFTTQPDGVLLGQQVAPIRRVGIYVPGGRASYPSTVLMNAIPAVVAGVEEIAMVAPPTPDGTIAPATLAAAAIAGVSEVYRVGGAQAIAALAFGTATIPRVDKITGPGNAYVTAAKKLVMGEVGIDMLAGPSEVCVLADETAEPAFVAIDLMAQAEHDPRAATYLVTTDPELPAEVDDALDVLLAEAERADVVRRSLTDNGRVIVAADLLTALDAVDAIAPEHLEVMMEDPFELLGSIRNAGAIFLGPWTPAAVGDYVAGPNHVLPTGGTARFASPLSVDDFMKTSSVVSYSQEALEADAATLVTLATAEGLDGACRRGRAAPRARRRGRRGGVRMGALRPPRPDLEGLAPYEAHEPRVETNLASNENPLNLPSDILMTISDRVRDFAFNRYPDPMANALRETIAQANGLDPGNVIVGNGGDELIFDLMLAWGGPGRRLLNLPPTFAMYDIDARVTGTEVVEVPRSTRDFSVDEAAVLDRLGRGDIDLIAISHPNNPTGNLDPETFLIDVLKASDSLVLVDEAYFEFSRHTMRPHMERHPNLVILRTFSKAFSLAGLRVGYLLAHEDVVRELTKVRQPYSVDRFSQWVADLAFRERVDLRIAHPRDDPAAGARARRPRGPAGRGSVPFRSELRPVPRGARGGRVARPAARLRGPGAGRLPHAGAGRLPAREHRFRCGEPPLPDALGEILGRRGSPADAGNGGVSEAEYAEQPLD